MSQNDGDGTYSYEVDTYTFGAIIQTLALGKNFNNDISDLQQIYNNMGKEKFIQFLLKDDSKIINDIVSTFGKEQRYKILYVLASGASDYVDTKALFKLTDAKSEEELDAITKRVRRLYGGNLEKNLFFEKDEAYDGGKMLC